MVYNERMTAIATPVRTFMSSPVRSVREDASLDATYAALCDRSLSSLAVVDASDRPVGVISRTDLLRLGRVLEARERRMPLLDFPAQTVGEVMHRGVVTVAPDAPVSEAAAIMVHEHIHRVFVGSATHLVGVFSTKDVMRAVSAARIARPISDFMSAPVITVRALETIATATDRLADAHVAGLVVLDDDDAPVGVFTQLEALQAKRLSAATPVEDAMSYAMLCLDVHMPLYRAAAHAAETRVRRLIAVDRRRVWGVLTGIDFARAAV